VGLDRSLVGAFGHDDRVCAYAALEPMLRMAAPEKTAVCVLADKEEIGSVGVSGMQSQAFEAFMEALCEAQGASLRVCFANSCCLSTDVTNAFDPSFASVSDKSNNTQINYGLGICKYTGSRGKSGASDAAAELVSRVRTLFDANGVLWQMGELGRVDVGGGGTIAYMCAKYGMNVIDAGIAVLSMHAPWEIAAKCDLWEAYRCYCAFAKEAKAF
jgi:aspartyl aminopeptidase